MKVLYLQRIKSVKKPRKDWDLRWYSAALAVKSKGVVTIKDENGRATNIKAAKKDSPIWKALAKGEGGFKDAIGSGKPPFAYGSGMGWAEAEIKEKEKDDSIKKRIATKLKSLLPRIITIKII